MLFIQYPKCSTCQKAKKWLDAHSIIYTDHHIVDDDKILTGFKEAEWEEKLV